LTPNCAELAQSWSVGEHGVVMKCVGFLPGYLIGGGCAAECAG
jgi:hypothetical protein